LWGPVSAPSSPRRGRFALPPQSRAALAPAHPPPSPPASLTALVSRVGRLSHARPPFSRGEGEHKKVTAATAVPPLPLAPAPRFRLPLASPRVGPRPTTLIAASAACLPPPLQVERELFCHSPRPSMTPNPRPRRRYDLESRPTRPPRHPHHCPRLRRRFLPSSTLLSSSTSSSHHFSPPPSGKTRVFRGLVRRIMCLCVVGCLFLTSVIMCDQSCAICVVNRHFQRGGWPLAGARARMSFIC